MQSKVKQLWQLCFDDSEAFTELYFRLRCKDDVNMALQEDGKVVAALQMLPYPMTFGGEEISTAYVSGACTHPDYRNRGLMRRLLSEAFADMRGKGVEVSTLIPAEPWLFDYYARSGYAAVFCRAEEHFVASAPSSEEVAATALECVDGYREDVYRYLYEKQKERPCGLLHTQDDFKVVLADLVLSGGRVYALRPAESIVALAIVYPMPMDAAGACWHIEEILSDTPADRTRLLHLLCTALSASALHLSVPTEKEASEGAALGMARIVHAPAVLRRYASMHPELTLAFRLTDKQLPVNNGYYYLRGGHCATSAEPLPVDHLSLTIGELTRRIFEPLHPYMCLMMN